MNKIKYRNKYKIYEQFFGITKTLILNYSYKFYKNYYNIINKINLIIQYIKIKVK